MYFLPVYILRLFFFLQSVAFTPQLRYRYLFFLPDVRTKQQHPHTHTDENRDLEWQKAYRVQSDLNTWTSEVGQVLCWLLTWRPIMFLSELTWLCFSLFFSGTSHFSTVFLLNSLWSQTRLNFLVCFRILIFNTFLQSLCSHFHWIVLYSMPVLSPFFLNILLLFNSFRRFCFVFCFLLIMFLYPIFLTPASYFSL